MNLRTWILAALVALVCGATASAAAPPAPDEISARSFDNGINASVIGVSWHMPQGTYDILRYKIYGRLRGTAFTLIDTVSAPNPNDSAFGNYYWQNITVDGTYDIYVTGVNADGEGSPSDTVEVEVVTPPFRFHHWPSNYDSLYVGVEYTDSVNVVATDGGGVRYRIYPVGHNYNTATVDSVTGALSWTPSVPGQFQFMVIVTLVSDPSVSDTGYLVFNVVDPNNLLFVSQSLYAQVDSGQTVRHYFRVAGGGGGTVTYGLVSIGNASTIDVNINASTGEAEFTPHAYGTYQFIVGAYLNGSTSPSATQGGAVQAVDPSTVPVSIRGYVVDSSWSSVRSLVKVYRLTGDSANNPVYTLYDSTQPNSAHFSFRGLPSGSYVVHAAPNDTDHASAYYRANFDVALSWDDATLITGNSDIDSAVVVTPLIEGHGSNRLGGRVVRSAGRAGLRDRSLGSADVPLANAAVFAVDNNGHVQGMDMTDANGQFEVNGLGAGTFTVLVDHINYTTENSSVSFPTNANGSQDVNIHAESASGTSGVLIDPIRVEIARTWPTPTRDNATVKFAGVAGGAQLTVVDGAGRVVRSSTLSTTTGENLLVLETSDMEAGSYIVRIAMPNRVVTAPLVIVR